MNTAEARVEKYRQSAKSGATDGYRGIPIHARAGLHEAVAELVQRHIPAGALLIDLAAGGGAMSLRLNDLGYRVVSCDYVTENFRLHGKIEFRQIDLNKDFSRGFSSAQGVVAVEIIEHLENPRHFMREIRSILSAGGVAIVTTPNVDSPASVAMGLRTGRPVWFDERNYRGDGHITPVPHWVLRQAAVEAGLDVVEMITHGDPYLGLAGWPRMRWFAKAIGRVMTPDIPRGEILVAVLRSRG